MSYIPNFEINDKIRLLLEEIEKLKDKVHCTHILPEAKASIRLRASVETVHSSTSIEGNPLSTSQVRAVMNSDSVPHLDATAHREALFGSAQPLTREEYAEIEVKNYQHALDYIEERRFGDSNLTIDDILNLHHIISHHLLDDTRSRHFRHNPVYIENQKREILYTAVEAALVANELEDLITWVNASRFSLHPVLIAAILHFRIAAIHPFADGNGRTARAMVSLYLALNNYDCDGSLVLDSYYATNRQAYYAILQLVNGENYESSYGANLTPWLEYFADGFLTSLHVLDAETRIANLLSAGISTEKLSREDQDILSYVSTFGAITIAEAMDVLPEKGRRSVQRRLKKLVELGYLEQVGEGKGVKYKTITT